MRSPVRFRVVAPLKIHQQSIDNIVDKPTETTMFSELISLLKEFGTTFVLPIAAVGVLGWIFVGLNVYLQ
jgi:hypothetical protein